MSWVRCIINKHLIKKIEKLTNLVLKTKFIKEFEPSNKDNYYFCHKDNGGSDFELVIFWNTKKLYANTPYSFTKMDLLMFLIMHYGYAKGGKENE